MLSLLKLTYKIHLLNLYYSPSTLALHNDVVKLTDMTHHPVSHHQSNCLYHTAIVLNLPLTYDTILSRKEYDRF